MRLLIITITAIAFMITTRVAAALPRPTVVLEGDVARLAIDLAGGSISSFQLRGHPLNPLSWDSLGFNVDSPPQSPSAPRSMGHFLCLDRWGPATEAEQAHGMGWHGEATRVVWEVVRPPISGDDSIAAVIKARLPLAGLSVERSIQLPAGGAAFIVTESVTNERPLGRIYNIVQHATIAPPFLEAGTVVDCNGTRGFMQETPMPNPEMPEVRWPYARKQDGAEVDLRRLHGDDSPTVVSYIVDDEFGWITAINAEKRLLIGYLWHTADYPWINLWRNARDGAPMARGLEFGTTGLHQPGPALVEKGKIFDRHLFRFIDADETQTFSYAGFLAEIPEGFGGVESVSYTDLRATIRERDGENRTVTVEVGALR